MFALRFVVRRGAVLLFGAGLALMGAVAAAPVASAAAPSGLTITDVRTTSAAVAVGEQIRTNIDFALADRTAAGRTTELTLPAALVSLPAGFDLRATDGSLVATAVITTGYPTVVTLTTTDYGLTHVDVHGTAFILGNFDATVAQPGRRTRLEFSSGGRTFADILTVAPGGSVDRTRSFQFGQFVRGDQGRTVARGALYWFVESPIAPRGGWAATEFKDPMAGGGSIQCAGVNVTIGDATGLGNGFADGIGYGDYSFVQPCTGGGLDLETGYVPAGKVIRVQFTADLTGPTGANPTSFINGATVITQAPDGRLSIQASAGRLDQSQAGGTVDGSGPAATHTASRTTASTGPAPTAAKVSPKQSTSTKPSTTSTPSAPVRTVISSPATVSTAGITTTASKTDGPAVPGVLIGGALLLFGSVLLIGRTRRRG